MSSDHDQFSTVQGVTPRNAVRAAGAADSLAPEPAAQHALAFAPDGGVALVTEPAERRTTRRDTLRGDAKRTAEYLATRGRTPIEAVHNLSRMDPWRAVRKIVAETGCTRQWALQFWLDCNLSLLPYTAAKLDVVELGGSAAGSLAMAHFLAASAVGVALSPNRQLVDKPETSGLPLLDGTISADRSRLILPPKGTD